MTVLPFLRRHLPYHQHISIMRAQGVEGRRLDILAEKEFLRLYLEAMLQVKALAARCERCPRTSNLTRP